MSTQRALVLAAGLATWAACQAPAGAAQVIPAQPARYMLSADASDARALWVNPAGLSRHVEASLGADLTVERLSSDTQPAARVSTQLSQYGLALSSRGAAVGWVHDRYPGGTSVDAYALGLGLGDETFSMGATRRWFRGAVQASFWDLGARAIATDWFQLSLVAKNISSPTPRDAAYAPSVVPGFLAIVFDGRLRAAGEWELVTRGWRSRELRVGGSVALWGGLSLAARADLAPDLKGREFAVALHLEAPTARATSFARLPGGLGGIDSFGLAGSLVARGTAARR